MRFRISQLPLMEEDDKTGWIITKIKNNNSQESGTSKAVQKQTYLQKKYQQE